MKSGEKYHCNTRKWHVTVIKHHDPFHIGCIFGLDMHVGTLWYDAESGLTSNSLAYLLANKETSWKFCKFPFLWDNE